MANLARWDPFGEMLSLRDAMNRLFEESFVLPAGASGGPLSMPLDLRETENAFIVDVAVPGVRPEDLDITVRDNLLTINAETRREQQTGEQQASYHRVERRYGRFSRAISLPTQVNADQVQTRLENGILHLELPKAEASRPHRITVNTGRALEGRTVDVNTQSEQAEARGQ